MACHVAPGRGPHAPGGVARRAGPRPLSAEGRGAGGGQLAYFAAHTGRVGYAGRLATGRGAGSGAAEGPARRVGGRLKCPGRGWLGRRADPMAALACTARAAEWDALWDALAP
jgi:hypothetical protein